VKAVRPDLVALYQKALRDTTTLSHPAAVCIYDAFAHDDWLFVIQELVVGQPLGVYLRQGVPVERAVDLAAQMARALAHAHLHGVVHGDLSPGAVLVDRNAIARINNFGLPPDAAYLGEMERAVAASLPATDGAEVAERADGQGAVTVSTAGDVRALGYLLWQLVTEVVNSDAANAPVADARRFRAEVPEALRAIVTRTVLDAARDQIHDPQSLVQELEALAQELARVRPVASAATPPAVLAARAAAAREAPWSTEDTVGGGRSWSGGAQSGDRTVPEGTPLLPGEAVGAHGAAEGEVGPFVGARARPLSRPVGDPREAGVAPRWSFPGADALEREELGRGGFPLIAVLLLGGVLFVLFFLVGFYVH
jgi:eukaryotic-like serine/threonine-protein kinase